MKRMLDGAIIEIREEMVECALHGGNWQQGADFCVIDDRERYTGYLACTRVDQDDDEEDMDPDYEDDEDEPLTEEEQDEIAALLGDEDADKWDDPYQQVAEYERAQNRLSYTGLAPDAPITENDQGGKQSLVEGRFDLLPPVAMFELAKVMEHGAEKYAPRNWYKIPVESHLNHLLMHVFAYIAGDRQEQHLTHALARAAMAVEIETLSRRAPLAEQHAT